jgi:hypothetical protein
MTSNNKTCRRPGLLQDRSGTSAIEFALLLPVLILMLFGTVELHRYMLHKRHIEAAAKAVANMVGQRPESASVVGESASMDFDLVRHMFPELNFAGSNDGDWWRDIAFQVSHVAFTPTMAGCTSSCTYTANVAWSWPTRTSNVPRGSLERTCGALTAAAAGQTPTGSTLPASLFGPGSLTIVDIQYQFTPLLGATIVPAQTILGQGFATSRFVTPYIKSDSAMNTLRCPGY